VTCIRTIAPSTRRVPPRASCRPLSEAAEEIARLFSRYPEASQTLEIAGRCRFSLDELAYQYPQEQTMPGRTPQQRSNT